MTTTRELMAIFRAIAAEDIAAAKAAALQVCKAEEKNGHTVAARQLRGALLTTTNALPRNVPEMTSFEQQAGILSTALVRLEASTRLDDVVLGPRLHTELKSVIDEWTWRDHLRKRGIAPRSKLLFHGPPGCGKSITARAIAHSLNLPVYMVRFDAVIGAFLGQTAIHLRQLFHFAETTPCVLLLDELDALGKKRGSPLDVGELDRIVISLLQELEHSKPAGLVIGTTNLPTHLDNALWRRFDLDLSFRAPGKVVLARFVRNTAEQKRVTLPADVVRNASKAPSFAAAESLVIAEVRRQVLKPLLDK